MADTLIVIPDWAITALNLEGLNIYIHPNNNDEYVVCDTADFTIGPPTWEELIPPPKKRKVALCKMSKLSFATHFLSCPERPSAELLGKIYDSLEGVDINQQTLDVVDAVIKSIYTKSLKNTIGRVKRSRGFKRQMQYILNKIFG